MSNHDGDIAIKVRNLSKMYKVYAKPLDMIWEIATGKPRHSEFWALRDVSFDVKRGDVVGLIGRNGAGKTTMLRILADTLDKTSGQVEVEGKVSAIMALGTGFNPELSGRENILMGGLCLGMTRAEIMRKMDSIIDFSGLEDFIEQTVKTYSSGMLSRLAFSTAVSVDPDILIIDEALSTGDMIFAARSFARIRQIATSGATVFFVTHALQQIYDLCNTAILLERGRIIEMGQPRQVGYAYEEMMHDEMAKSSKRRSPVYSIAQRSVEKETSKVKKEARITTEGSKNYETLSRDTEQGYETTLKEDTARLDKTIGEGSSSLSLTGKRSDRQQAPGAEVIDVIVLNANGQTVKTLDQHKEYTIQVRVLCNETYNSISIGIRIQNPGGTTIYGTSTSVQGIDVASRAGEIISVQFIFDCSLASGTYLLSSGVAENLGEVTDHYLYSMIQYYSAAETIEVVGSAKFSGYVDLKSRVKTVKKKSID